jgi:glycosyltransferase involved in cell wall biosynthesis
MKPKVAFVVQRAGKEVNGGAEYHCMLIAERMGKYWDVEIITTCALDYVTWENHYPEGKEFNNGITINRFKVDNPRDIISFNELSDYLNSLKNFNMSLADKWMKAQGPFSTSMLDYIEDKKDTFNKFIFFTYLYAHTWFGLPKVSSKSILIPLAHDEWTIHLDIWKALFQQVNQFVFNTDTEKKFLCSKFQEVKDGPIIGVTVNKPSKISPQSFRNNYDIKDDFIIYVGRIDPSKNCEQLFEYFLNVNVKKGVGPQHLVVLGKATMDIPQSTNIHHLGFVDEATKWSAIAAAQFLVMPSLYESLSMVLLEAWAVSKPVLVNGNCKVLAQQCKKSNGGFYYKSIAEYELFNEALSSKHYSYIMGMNGYNFFQNNYDWNYIEKEYNQLLKF